MADIDPEIAKRCVEFYFKDGTPMTVDTVEEKLKNLRGKKCCHSGCGTCITTVWARFEKHLQKMKES
jgi:hypothetical protein